jgi:formamidopyrimidine-DNA glycosylase
MLHSNNEGGVSMLELPEVLAFSKQFNESIAGRRIRVVQPPSKPHKLCWFAGDPAEYDARMRGAVLACANGFGSQLDLELDNGFALCVSDGVTIRFLARAEAPTDYQLLVAFEDESALVFTVAMYGGIVLHDGTYDNPYYQKSKNSVSPFSEAFESYFRALFFASKPSLSAKAFLATEQRFPGIGNGALQDILLNAGIHPKRKICSLAPQEQTRLLEATVSTLREMTDLGGRDTEKDLYGNPGGYRTKLSKNTLAFPCPQCGGSIVKEAYLGGAVYYCPNCQPLD